MHPPASALRFSVRKGGSLVADSHWPAKPSDCRLQLLLPSLLLEHLLLLAQLLLPFGRCLLPPLQLQALLVLVRFLLHPVWSFLVVDVVVREL